MHPIGFSRRRFLETLAAGAAAAPLLPLLGRSVAYADTGDDVPMRLVLLYFPHGTSFPQWRPQKTGDTFNIDFPESILAPLARFKHKLCVIEGLDMLSAYRATKSGHEGTAGLFTGGCTASSDTTAVRSTHPSIDHLIGNHLQTVGQPVPHKVLNFIAGFDQTQWTVFFEGTATGSKAVSSEYRTQVAFNRIFDGLDPSGPDPDQQARTARRQSILGRTRAALNRLRPNVGGFERQKLDAHLQAIEDLDARFRFALPTSCQLPAIAGAGGTDGAGAQAIEEFGTIMTQALACRLTHVVGLQMHWGGYFSMPYIGIQRNTHEDLSHGAISNGAVVSNPSFRTDYLAMQTFWSEATANILEKMDAIVEENGKTLLDNTIVVMASEFGDPALHANIDLPIVLAGGGGKIQMNRYLQFQFSNGNHNQHLNGQGSAPHNQLLTSICRAFGMDVNHVGDDSYTGELPGLLT